MSIAELANLARYVLMALIGAVVTTGMQLGVVLGGEGDIIWRPLAATFTTAFFGALATALGASQLTRFGSEGLSKQVDHLRDAGVSRQDMAVVTKHAVADAKMTEEEVKFLREEAARLRRIKPFRDAEESGT